MAAVPDPESLDPALAAQFEQIRQAFVTGLPRREREIDGAANPGALQGALHRLAGAAGGFGYPTLGELARESLLAHEAGDATRLTSSLACLKAELRRLSEG